MGVIRPYHIIILLVVVGVVLVVRQVRRSGRDALAAEPHRASWPTLTATIVITALFGVFGVIPAYLHTEAVRNSGAKTSRYWKTFGFTLLATIAAYMLLIVGVLTMAG